MDRLRARDTRQHGRPIGNGKYANGIRSSPMALASLPEIPEPGLEGTNVTGDPSSTSAAGRLGNLHFINVTSRVFLEFPRTATLNNVTI